jgi:hypothetical protein
LLDACCRFDQKVDVAAGHIVTLNRPGFGGGWLV